MTPLKDIWNRLSLWPKFTILFLASILYLAAPISLLIWPEHVLISIGLSVPAALILAGISI